MVIVFFSFLPKKHIGFHKLLHNNYSQQQIGAARNYQEIDSEFVLRAVYFIFVYYCFPNPILCFVIFP